MLCLFYLSLVAAGVLTELGDRLETQWKRFGIFLKVDGALLDAIEKERLNISKDCMLELLNKWISLLTGTGSLPRTWQTVVEAVYKTGYGELAQQLARSHRVDLAINDQNKSI